MGSWLKFAGNCVKARLRGAGQLVGGKGQNFRDPVRPRIVLPPVVNAGIRCRVRIVIRPVRGACAFNFFAVPGEREARRDEFRAEVRGAERVGARGRGGKVRGQVVVHDALVGP